MGGLGPRVIFHIWQRCISGRRGSTAAADAGGAAARRERPIDGDGGGGFGRHHEEDERVDRRKICDRRLSQACAAGNGASERTERTFGCAAATRQLTGHTHAITSTKNMHWVRDARGRTCARGSRAARCLCASRFCACDLLIFFRLLWQCMAHRRSSAAGGARQREQLRGRVENRLNKFALTWWGSILPDKASSGVGCFGVCTERLGRAETHSRVPGVRTVRSVCVGPDCRR